MKNFWTVSEDMSKAIIGLSLQFEGTKVDIVEKAITVALINVINDHEVIPVDKFIRALHNTSHINIIDGRIHKTPRGEIFFKLLTGVKK